MLMLALCLAHSQFSKDSSRNRKEDVEEPTLWDSHVRGTNFPFLGGIKIILNSTLISVIHGKSNNCLGIQEPSQ